MKRVLITGADSYIGTAVKAWLEQVPEAYVVEVLDMREAAWRNLDFSRYDAVFHVAGIVHVRGNHKNRSTFYVVNRDLVFETAQLAKQAGVHQFIFMSTMNVYGKRTGRITRNTVPAPRQEYGKSKLCGEKLLQTLVSESFRVAVLRPPMVYGPGCKGNFQRLLRLVKKVPFFPDIENQRSLLYIDNLCEYVRMLIDRGTGGLYFPQNKEYVRTRDMVRTMGKGLKKNIRFSKALGAAVRIALPFCGAAQKAFGTLIYEETEMDDFLYCVVEQEESILRSIV